MPPASNQAVTNLTVEDLSAIRGLGDTVKAVKRARARLRSIDEVLDTLEQEPLIPYDERRLLLLPLQETTLTPAQVQRLQVLVDAWGGRAELSGGRNGDRLYGLMRSVLELLPRESRVKRCIAYVSHHHVHRRLIACR